MCWSDIDDVYAGCRVVAAVTEGRLRTASMGLLYQEPWRDVTMVACDKELPSVFFGLTADGRCMISDDPSKGPSPMQRLFARHGDNDIDYEGISYWLSRLRDIVQIAVNGSLFMALDKFGTVHVVQYRKCWFTGPDPFREQARTICYWNDIRRILITELDIVVAQKNSGELVCAGSTQDLFGTFGRKAFSELQDSELVDACGFYGGESMHFAFLGSDGMMHCNRFDSEGQRFIQLEGLDHEFVALREDGKVISFQGPLDGEMDDWPAMKRISLGRMKTDTYDNLFLVGLASIE